MELGAGGLLSQTRLSENRPSSTQPISMLALTAVAALKRANAVCVDLVEPTDPYRIPKRTCRRDSMRELNPLFSIPSASVPHRRERMRCHIADTCRLT